LLAKPPAKILVKLSRREDVPEKQILNVWRKLAVNA
jgi:hypothetical protein